MLDESYVNRIHRVHFPLRINRELRRPCLFFLGKLVNLEIERSNKLIFYMPNQGQKLIGQISHYYGNIGVAVIELSDNLKVGDRIRFLGGSVDFEQEVSSMEADYKKVNEVSSGTSVGLKTDQKVKEGYKVYRV